MIMHTYIFKYLSIKNEKLDTLLAQSVSVRFDKDFILQGDLITSTIHSHIQGEDCKALPQTWILFALTNQ